MVIRAPRAERHECVLACLPLAPPLENNLIMETTHPSHAGPHPLHRHPSLPLASGQGRAGACAFGGTCPAHAASKLPSPPSLHVRVRQARTYMTALAHSSSPSLSPAPSACRPSEVTFDLMAYRLDKMASLGVDLYITEFLFSTVGFAAVCLAPSAWSAGA